LADDQKLEQLKQKYQSVLNTIQQQGIRLQNVHLQEGKLFIRGTAPSSDAKNRVWDQIKLVDPSYSDLTADITVEESGTQTAAAGAGSGQREYTVQAGDTLSKISKQFYGDASQYMRIFEANRDQLKDPDKIRAGQRLMIP
jgi:nucleoid-associated protein YgaU